MSPSTDQPDPWATLDGLLGIETAGPDPEHAVGELAFYGRCSTEDNQDPETSRGWQLSNARKFVEPYGGVVLAEFFDVGQSRSVPWERRREGARLLAALKDPRRTWTGVVVGEGTRCWFGNQFSLIAPRFAAYGVELWVPELGGRFDPRNPSHKMLMSVLGGMSESERQHVQARVRAAMDTQVVNEGRHQGGRAPYGYVVVDGGPHPNPRKAAEGFRLRVLEIDEAAAEVVRRIFAEYAGGTGTGRSPRCSTPGGVPCPSARRRDQNRHRLADGWQGSTVRAILDNPRYTGYAIFGRWTRHETLLDPDDVAAGHVTRFRRPRRNGSCAPGRRRIRRSCRSRCSPGAVAAPDQERRRPGDRTEGRAGPSRHAAALSCCAGWSAAASAGGGCRATSCARRRTTGAASGRWRRARLPWRAIRRPSTCARTRSSARSTGGSGNCSTQHSASRRSLPCSAHSPPRRRSERMTPRRGVRMLISGSAATTPRSRQGSTRGDGRGDQPGAGRAPGRTGGDRQRTEQRLCLRRRTCTP